MARSRGTASTSSASSNKHAVLSARVEGFDVHCAVRIAAEDDLGRERLLRYCMRRSFALDRIEQLPDGRIAYRASRRRGAEFHWKERPSSLSPGSRAWCLHANGPHCDKKGCSRPVRVTGVCSVMTKPPSTRVPACPPLPDPTTITVKHWGRLLDATR